MTETTINNLERIAKITDKYGVEIKTTNPLDAADWTKPEDSFTQEFAARNQMQFWRPEEFPIANDIASFDDDMEHEEREVYMKSLAGLALLDTTQGDVGMPILSLHTKGHQRKALINWMAMIENLVHVKSYSGIFITLLSKQEIHEKFEWVKENKVLQAKARIFEKMYLNAFDDTPEARYKSLVTSSALESFAFYSGFYYPILKYGEATMLNSGDTINTIMRDEAIHGVYGGLLAQEEFNKFTPAKQKELRQWTIDFMKDIYIIEEQYTKDLYDTIGNTQDVLTFVQFNGNTTMANLGFDPIFSHDALNPIIMNGLNTGTKSHNFFIQKSSSYINATIESMQNEDFDIKSMMPDWMSDPVKGI